MSPRLRKTIAVIAAASFALVGIAYWYWSPLIALQQMQSAAKARDADAFNRHVDYPRLRDDMKLQFGAKLAGAMAAGPTTGEAQRAGAALGTALGVALVDKMVDAMVQPDAVMQAMSAGKAAAWLERLPGIGSDSGPSAAEPNAQRKIEWRLDREGADRVIAYAMPADAAAAEATAPGGKPAAQIGLVFERSGLGDWKLAGLRLPDDR